ncbi:cytochrome P450 [Fusarium sp. MPI-SDFR-AT-0072]|nr:cytochrome P450 [Fusarium sp. MPI-SDFR-AT-0072]
MSVEDDTSAGFLRDVLQGLADHPRAVIVTAVLGLVVLFVADTLRTWHRLSHVPGPFWAGFSKAWMVRQSFKGIQPYAIQQANEKYGSLVRIGPNELATDDPKLLKRMMSSRSAYTRGPWYNALRFEPGKDNLFSMRDDDAHAKLRNKMAAGYSGKENESLERTIDEHIAKLINLLETKYLSTDKDYRPVDFAQKIQFFTLDVISDLAFGQAFGYIEQDDDVFDFIKITKSYFPVTLIMANIPSLVSLLHSKIFSGALPKESDKLGFGAFIGVANKKVAERFAPGAKSHPDMLGSFIRHGLTQEQASRESLLNVVAGSDTSATTVRLIMLSLLSNPIMYLKLQNEIDDAIKAGSISSPIADAEARKLPYLQAVIQEGLRIKAPAAGPLFKQVPPQGDEIDGKFIPGGTQIGQSPFAVYHSTEIFGQDASLFSPERWINADPAKYEAMAEVCLGKPVAFIELNKIFVEVSSIAVIDTIETDQAEQLLRRFDFCMVRPERPLHIMNALLTLRSKSISSVILFRLNRFNGTMIGSSVLFVFGLVTNVAIASVCKPRPSDSSSASSVESVTSSISATAPTTTVAAETTTATSVDLSTTFASTVGDETTIEAVGTATTTETSVTVDFSTTTETTGTAETATTDAITTAATTTAETTTADATTTTADTFVPIPTFDVLAIGAQVDGQKLRGHVTTYYEMGWNLDRTPPILAFSIDPDTNQVKEVNGNYLCLQYGDPNENYPNFLKLCDPGSVTNIDIGLGMVTCEQTRDRRLECSAPAAQCVEDDMTRMVTCSTLPGTFTGFYTYSDTLSAVTTSTNDATEIATTADATTAESTTTSDPTTSVSAPEPFETFDVLAIGGSIDGQYMKGVANEATMMGWDLTGTGIGHMPLFTIEPVTNYAKVLRNDLYLCIGYEDGSEPNFIADPPTDSTFQPIELGITPNESKLGL